MMSKPLLLLLGLPGIGLLAAALAAEGLPPLNQLVVPGIVIIILIMLNGLFVAAEFAIIGVRPTRIEQLVNEGNTTAAHVQSVLQSPGQPDRYIATAQLGITIASLGLGMYGEREVSHFIEPYLARILGQSPEEALILSLGYIISLSLLTYLHVVLGEMIPKSLALSSSERAVLSLDRPMRLMQAIFGIPVTILNRIGLMLMRVFRIPPVQGHARLYSMEELELIVSESAEEGMLEGSEEEIIRNIFDFGDRQVNQVMTPRRKVQALAFDTPLDILANFVAESNHSRFPVYDGDLDHVIGVFHIKDLVRHRMKARGSFDIRLLLRPAPTVPEHYPVEKMLNLFRTQQNHIAIVIDEFGGTAGIVTLEDLVEEIVGEVRDEFDLEREPLVEIEPGVLDVAGDYLLDDLDDIVYLGAKENLPDVETVGGLIVTGLGRPPQINDQYTHGEAVVFTVLAVDGLAVARARVEFPSPKRDNPEDAEDEEK